MFDIFNNFNIMEYLYRLPAILIALSFHEWAHAFAAYKLGDPTARNLGRLTVNPIKHIDPIGFICLLLFRFGWAKPVPVNPRNYIKPRRDDIFVSLAGVTVNLMLSFVSVGLYHLVFSVLGAYNYPIQAMLQNFIWINLGLMTFNLLPIPPLDGYHVFKNLTLRIFSPNFFMTIERYGHMILMIVLISGIGTRVLSFVPITLIKGFEGLWLMIFGLS